MNADYKNARRKFLKSGVLASGAIATGALVSCANQRPANSRNEPYPTFGKQSLLSKTKGVKGLLFSQVGYDPKFPVKVIFRAEEGIGKKDSLQCKLLGVSGEPDRMISMPYWGEVWGSHWWVADFGIFSSEGEWNIEVVCDNEVIIQDRGLKVKEDVLWNATYDHSSVGILEIRRHFTGLGDAGWQDAGSLWVESCAQSVMIRSLVELLSSKGEQLTEAFQARIFEQIIVGCDYLVLTYKRAQEHGYDKGIMVHDVLKNDKIVLNRDIFYAVVALFESLRVLPDSFSDKKSLYLELANVSYDWICTQAKPNNEGFSFIQRGLSDSTVIPEEWMTRDLLAICSAHLAYYQLSSSDAAKESAVALAQKIGSRQVKKSESEGEFYGHFREFDSLSHTESAWVHGIDANIFGVDLGGVYPNYLIPILEMLTLWPEHPEASTWKDMLHSFTFGYLIPVCSKNPFGIIPLGIFGEKKPIWFAGPFHGTNTIYGFTAALSMELFRLFNDERLRTIAYDNLQWIAGLNAGITKENLKESLVYSTDIPDGIALPASMICGIGDRWSGTWFQTRGVICNGFSVGKQFAIDTDPKLKNDGPTAFTDEDWIPHSASWITALCKI